MKKYKKIISISLSVLLCLCMIIAGQVMATDSGMDKLVENTGDKEEEGERNPLEKILEEIPEEEKKAAVGIGEDEIITDLSILESQIMPMSGDVVGTVYNQGGNTVTDVSGVTRTALLKWLGDHVNDNYYLGTPYAGHDNRNPNGDPRYNYGGGVVTGQPGMNCTGFVWHALTAAATMYGNGITVSIPGMQGWVKYLKNNHIEYKTYVGSDITDVVYTAVYEDNYIEPGDIIWTWDAVTTPTSSLVDGLANNISGYHHVGIYIGTYFDDVYKNGPNWQLADPYGHTPKWNRWWHSSDEGLGDTGFTGNQTSMVMPKRQCYALTVIKLGDKLEQKGSVELYKKSSEPEITNHNPCYSLAGAKYGLYSDGNGDVPVTMLVTDENGYARADNISPGTYWLKELENPKGFVIDYVSHLVEVQDKTVTKVNVQETPQKIQIELSKIDSGSEKAEPQGAAALENAKYAVVDSEDHVVDILVTDREGKAVSKELPAGDYTVQETEASNGYILDQETYKINGTNLPDRQSKVFMYRLKSKEDIIRGDVEIIKYIVNPDKEGGTLKGLAGVEFTFTSNTTGKVAKKIITDDEGFATTADAEHPEGSLIYDTYTVTETKYPPNVIPVESFEVTISENRVTMQGIYKENELIVSPVSVVKKDKSTGRVIPIKNSEFRILDADKQPLVLTACDSGQEYVTFQTDENGQFMLPERLEYGIYYLEELRAPKGYLKGNVLKFEVKENADWEHPLIIEYEDDNAMGRISVHKTDSDTGAELEGVVFEVTAEEDIVTPDGTVRLRKGEAADTLTTDAEGKAVSKELFLGKYVVEEIQGLSGYTKDKKSCKVELKYKDQTTPVAEEILELKNQPVKVVIKKNRKGTASGLSGVKYSIWKKGAQSDGALKMTDREIYTTDAEGQIILKYLEEGIYCIQEKETLPGYILDEMVYEFSVDRDGHTVMLTGGISQRDREFEMENDYTKLYISKQDITTDKELPGAKLQIIVSETGEVYEEWISEEEPHYIEAIPAGNYILRETAAPDGYETAQEISFVIENSGEKQKIVMKDKRKESRNGIVNTGDSSGIFGFVTAMSGAAGVFYFVCKKRKGRRR